MIMTELYLQQFYDSIALSLMSVKCELKGDKKFGGLVIFEADDFDDVKLQFEWIAVHFDDKEDVFHSSKKYKDWTIGFKNISENDKIDSLVLIDDTTDLTIPKEKQISLIKAFIHENFLWERNVFNEILVKG